MSKPGSPERGIINSGGLEYQKMKGKVTSASGDSMENQPLLFGRGPSKSPPSDMCFATYLIFYIYGVGHLLPWNFFITANKYFQYKLTCPSNESHQSCFPSFRTDFENYFSVAAMLPVVVMTAINIWLQAKIHFKYRMVISLSGMALLFGLTVTLVKVDTSEWVNGFFFLSLVIVVLTNVFSAIFQSSTFGFAGVFPSKYVASVMGGQACAGVFAAVAQVLTLAATNSHVTNSAIAYFCTGLLIILLCLLSFFVMMYLNFVRFHLSHTSVQRAKEDASKYDSTDLRVKTNPPFLTIFFKIKWYALSVFMVFAVTLSLFPSVLSHLESSNPDNTGWTGDYFVPLVTFLMYNCSDFAGRYIPQWIQFGRNGYVLIAMCTLRWIFVPLFLLCNFSNVHASHYVLFRHDAVPIILMLLFGLSNGYLSSLSMMAAPMSVSPEERETASTIMVFFLAFGLLFGSSISFIWTKAVLKIS